MKEPSHGKQHHAKVAHHIPGRVRIRIHKESRHPHILQKLKTDLDGQPGVHGVEVNEAAGSVTVKYDAQQRTSAGIFDLLQDFDVLVGTVMEAPHLEEEEEDNSGHSKAALTMAGALDDLDRRLSELTGHTLDLRVLFPLGLVGVGIWQISKHGLMFEMIPGWLLVWLGFDAFVKLNVLQHAQESPTAN